MEPICFDSANFFCLIWKSAFKKVKITFRLNFACLFPLRIKKFRIDAIGWKLLFNGNKCQQLPPACPDQPCVPSTSSQFDEIFWERFRKPEKKSEYETNWENICSPHHQPCHVFHTHPPDFWELKDDNPGNNTCQYMPTIFLKIFLVNMDINIFAGAGGWKWRQPGQIHLLALAHSLPASCPNVLEKYLKNIQPSILAFMSQCTERLYDNNNTSTSTFLTDKSVATEMERL